MTTSKLDLHELKRRVGLTPFARRLQLHDGFCRCPFHDGDGEKSFHVTSKDGVGLGTCFSKCARSFDAIDFIKNFDHVETREAINVLQQMAADGEQASTFPSRPKPVPMTAEVWDKGGRPVTDADVVKLAASRSYSATPAAFTLNELGFKVVDKCGQTFLDAPYRMGDTFYTVKERNLETKEFLQYNSVSQKSLFNIDAVRPECDVFVVESELDAAVLAEHGYIAVSVINAKQKEIEPEVRQKLITAGRIFVVGDGDDAGRACMDNIARLLPAEKVYRMPLFDAKDVGEWALTVKATEVVLGNFGEQWEALKAEALSSWVSQNIPFASQLSSEPQAWIIERLLPENGYLLVTGKFGGQKSLSAFYMAHGIETGAPIWGRKVARKTPVLYVDRENPQQVIGERRARLGIGDHEVRYWGDWIEGLETPNLDDPRLAEFAVREKGVIIFDSLTDWLEGESENDPSKMTEVARKFRRLARLGMGVIVLHHDNKNGAGYRGSTAIPAGSDMAIKMEKNERTGVVEVRTERFRMCAAWEMDIQFSFGEQYTCRVLKDTLVGDSHKQALADDLETVAGVLQTHHEAHQGAPMNQIQLKSALHVLGIGKDKAMALLTQGLKAGKWSFETGPRNSILYRLDEWQPDSEAL